MTPSKLFEVEVRGFVVLSFDLQGTTVIELTVYIIQMPSYPALAGLFYSMLS